MHAKRSPFLIPVLVCVVALIALLAYGVAQKQADVGIEKAIAEGKREVAAVREVQRLGTTDTTSLADYRGKVVLLNFWASWCDPCKAESPAIEKAYRKYKGDGFVVLGAGVDDLTKDAKAFVDEFDLTYPVVKYGSRNAAKDFGTNAMPESFLIDRQGRIAAVQRYQIDEKWLEQHVPPVLKEPVRQ